MKKVTFCLALIGAALLLIAPYACERKCTTSCPEGAYCNDGKCECEAGRYSFNSNCYDTKGEFYVGTNSDCYCHDTLILKRVASNSGDSLFLLYHYLEPHGTVNSAQPFYYSLPDGDSIFYPELKQECLITGNQTGFPTIYGKKQPDGNWKLRLEFRDPVTKNVLDECAMVLKKLK